MACCEQVLPWLYYRDEAQRLVGVSNNMAAVSEAELRRVRASATRLRSEVFQNINLVSGMLQACS